LAWSGEQILFCGSALALSFLPHKKKAYLHIFFVLNLNCTLFVCFLIMQFFSFFFMTEKLLAYFAAVAPLSDAEARAIQEGARVRFFPKGTLLAEEGASVRDSYFILQGCIREYCALRDEEQTTNFFTEGEWALSLDSSPSVCYWVCNEDTTAVVGNEEAARELFRRFPRLESVSQMVMERVFAKYRRDVAAYRSDTPEQRYERLLRERPSLLQRVAQYHIASYIGVQPESLSRMRKRLTEKSSSPPPSR
jgi:CRP-like cAMP-binding protein